VAHEDGTGRGITPEEVCAHLDRILTSESFANSGRISRFLRFAVESVLRGEGGKIKEYVIGREVFDRDDSYDPRLDPIVRVEARRLRAKLDEYYAGPGRQDALRIGFPKGSYAPVVQHSSAVAEAQPVRNRYPAHWLWAAGLLLAGVVGFFLLLQGSSHWRAGRPRAHSRIVVAPAHWFGWDSGETNAFEENLVEAVTGELTRRQTMQVVSWPSVLPYRNAGKRIKDVAAELRADTVLVVSVANRDDQARVTLHLVDPASDRKVWWADYRRSVKDAFAAQQELARLIAQELEAFQRTRQ